MLWSERKVQKLEEMVPVFRLVKNQDNSVGSDFYFKYQSFNKNLKTQGNMAEHEEEYRNPVSGVSHFLLYIHFFDRISKPFVCKKILHWVIAND